MAHNITTKVEGDVLTITVSLKDAANASPSKSGKTKLVASTGSFESIGGGPDGLKLQLNVTVPNK